MPKRSKSYITPVLKSKKSDAGEITLEADCNVDTEKRSNEENNFVGNDAEKECEFKINGVPIFKVQTMRVRRYNESNEIERLLLHNTFKVRQQIDHCDLTSFNQGFWPQADQDSMITYPLCAFSVPRPVHVASTQLQKMDMCYKRPYTRQEYRSRMLTVRTIHQRFMSSQAKRNKIAEKEGKYHRVIFDAAERLHNKPDPYFQGCYDYYYSGGNLCTLLQSSKVVHTSGERLHKLEISEFPVTDHYPPAHYLSLLGSLETAENSEIFEIKPMFTSPDNSYHHNCFIARQRNVISLNCLSKDQKMKVITQFRTKATPFISFAQPEYDHDRLLITTMKQHVRMYDLSNNVPRLAKLYNIEPENLNVLWNTIRPWRENIYLYANEYKFTFVDTRTTPDQWMASAILALDNNFPCDHISTVSKSAFNNLFYVGTNHRLHCMDVRCIKKTSFEDPNAVVCRWTHQLQHAPLLIDTCRIRNSEFIAISSPVAGDMHVCQLNRVKNNQSLIIRETQRIPKHIYRSPCMPYQPPTVLEAFEHARLTGKCIQPEARLHERIRACTSGLAFNKPSERDSDFALAELLTSNSLGDIFSHTLTKREGDESDSRGNSRSNEFMEQFSLKVATRNTTLNYTEIENFKSLRKVFLCRYLNAEVKWDLDTLDESENEISASKHVIPLRPQQVKNKRKRLNMGRWQKSFATLRSYKDALVSDLLSIWDIEIDDDNNQIGLDKLQANNLKVKADPSVKVRDWLDTNLNSEQPMTRLPSHLTNEYAEQTIPNSSELTQQAAALSSCENNNMFNDTDINLTQISLDFENAIQSTQVMESSIHLDDTVMETQLQNSANTSMEKSKQKKKAKKYVKGF